MAVAEIKMSEVTHGITLRVRGLYGFGVRLAIARVLFRLCAYVAGVNFVVEQSITETTKPGDEWRSYRADK
jgi:hypothetical protein